MENKFFEAQTPSSRIKANIVSEYFPKYCRILLKQPQRQIRYVDLFAGPGLYDDGSISTPILVGKSCSKDPNLSKIVWLIFNDNKYSEKLKENFENCFPPGTFKHPPIFTNRTVGEDERIRSYLFKQHSRNGKNPHPTLLFIDPFGYKGVDTQALAAFLQNWGNEIFLFVNIKRIHAAVENKKFDDLMWDLFPTTINEIRKDRKYSLKVEDRLNLIIQNLAEEYNKVIGDKVFYTAFKFQEEDNSATSHYILHLTKHSRGYDLVKQIYHDFDNIGATLDKDGTYTFDAKKIDTDKNSLLDFGDHNIYSLSKKLKERYSGQKISSLKLFEEHQRTTRFSRKHYVQTLRKMVEDGDVEAKFTDTIKHEVSVLINEYCLLQFK